MDLMPQHNHHCWITFMGLNWSIVGCAPNLIHIRCMMGGAEVISAIDTRAVEQRTLPQLVAQAFGVLLFPPLLLCLRQQALGLQVQVSAGYEKQRNACVRNKGGRTTNTAAAT